MQPSMQTVWAVAVVAAFLGGVCIDRAFLRFSDDATTKKDAKILPRSGTAVLDAAVKAGHQQQEGEAGDPYAAAMIPAPYPFEDGRRAVAPSAGGVLANARAVYAEITEEVLVKWGREYDDRLFSGGMSFSDGGRVVENKMLNAVVDQGGFVAAFTGISITAGHDCLYEQSYPVLLNATMSRLMAATGVRFEAINVAIGNSRIAPYSYCVDAYAGVDADIISWEMGMEIPDLKCGPAVEAVELFVRSASVLPRRPAVLLMDAEPDQNFCDNGRLPSLVKRTRGFVGDCSGVARQKNLMSVYRHFGLHHMHPSTLVPTHTCGDDRFSREKMYGGAEKHFPRPMSWHPAPGGHALVADMLFMHYGKVFLNALERLEELAPGATATQLRKTETPSRIALGKSLGLGNAGKVPRGSMPEGGGSESGGSPSGVVFMGGGRGDILPRAAWCGSWRFCIISGDFKCANTNYPLAGKNGNTLVDMVSARTPVANRDQGTFLAAPSKGRWALTLNEVKQAILDYLEETPPKGMNLPIDKKWVLIGDQLSGPIEFEFETIGVPPVREGVGGMSGGGGGGGGSARNSVAKDSRITVCKPDFIDYVGLGDANGVVYRVDGVKTSVVRILGHSGLHPGSCALLAVEVGVGRHTLTVEPLKVGRPYVAISHVIYPA